MQERSSGTGTDMCCAGLGEKGSAVAVRCGAVWACAGFERV